MSPQPNGYALVIGIANYFKVNSLPGIVAKDAKDVAKILTSPDSCGFRPENVKLLADSKATKSSILSALESIAHSATEDDPVVIYFSGHGGTVPTKDDSFLIPYDCDPASVEKTAISNSELTSHFASFKSKKLVVILDACHAAGATELKAISPVPELAAGLSTKAIDALAQGAGKVVMASCRVTEVSFVVPGYENSIFTHFLLEGIRSGVNAGEAGEIKVFELFQYVSDKVPEVVPNQHPVFKANDLENNFVVAVRATSTTGKIDTSPPKASRPASLSGKKRVAIMRSLGKRWKEVAEYYVIPPYEQSGFASGDEAREILHWLENRGRLTTLRDAFNYLGYDDLIELLDSPESP